MPQGILTIANWFSSLTSGGGAKALSSGVAQSVGDVLLIYAVTMGAQGAITATDNCGDGLGTYTKVVDSLDNATTSQMTLLARDHRFGTADMPTFTVTIPAGATSGGAMGVMFRAGPPAASVGLAAVRQYVTTPNQAASAVPVFAFTNPTVFGNPVCSGIFADSASSVGFPSSPGTWLGSIATTITGPPAGMARQAQAASGADRNLSWTGGSGGWATPTVTYCLISFEFANVPEPVHGARMNLADFPKGGNW